MNNIKISSHILDTQIGKPAANVQVKLYNSAGQCIAESLTNADGRVNAFEHTETAAGHYRLVFMTDAYFQSLGIEHFFVSVTIDFCVNDPTQHYHIPLLLSPFAYSTYRGS